jgi:hypothetical protein
VSEWLNGIFGVSWHGVSLGGHQKPRLRRS